MKKNETITISPFQQSMVIAVAFTSCNDKKVEGSYNCRYNR
jgi:hypothetical protein